MKKEIFSIKWKNSWEAENALEFKDGETGKKLLIILNTPQVNIINAIGKCVKNSDDISKYHLSVLR